MLAIWVKVRIKPTMKDKFLKAIEVDALGSERDEARLPALQRAPGRERRKRVLLLREFDKDEAAIEAHRAAPHYDVWRGGGRLARRPDGGGALHPGLPAARPYWGKV